MGKKVQRIGRRHVQLYYITKEEINRYIREHSLKPGDLLPSESSLYREMGVSRGTLREAMRMLEEEGIIRRKQGLGTYVNGGTLLQSTLDVNEGVTEMILGKGMTPGCMEMLIEEVPADQKISQNLRVTIGEPLICVRRVRTADDQPVVYSVDFLPRGIIPKGFEEEFDGEFLYRFLEDRCGIEISNSVLQIQPEKANRFLAEKLGIRVGAVLMLLVQTDVDQSSKPVLYSQEYFRADRFQFVVYRRRRKVAEKHYQSE